MSKKYKFDIPGSDITFTVERLRYERHELIGELTVQCGIPGARLIDNYLHIGDLNFSSVRARQDRARLLRERAGTNGIPDWYGLLEDLSHRIHSSEREGVPAVDLREIPRRAGDQDTLCIDGLIFPRHHPSILFGDGGAAKSYTALFIAGNLARQGLSVALFDWELCGDDHRDRLERLFGGNMPRILYCPCENSLSVEADRLRFGPGLRRLVVSPGRAGGRS